MEKTTVEQVSKVLEIRSLTHSAFVLRFEKNDITFKAGQYLILGTKNNPERREYSIYSPEDADYLEVLVKLVELGSVSRRLFDLKAGDPLYIQGPLGFFNLDSSEDNAKHVFIASGSGISPFHSMALSYPDINYTLLHGVRKLKEGYERNHFAKGRYIQCTSGEKGSEFYGRVTDYLKKYRPDPSAHYYLCGNSGMIDEVWNILEDNDVSLKNIHAEVYF